MLRGPLVPADDGFTVENQWMNVLIRFAKLAKLHPFELRRLLVVCFGLFEPWSTRVRAIECIHLGEAVGNWSNTPPEFEVFMLTWPSQYGYSQILRLYLLQRVASRRLERVGFFTNEGNVRDLVPQPLDIALALLVMIRASVSDPCKPGLVLHTELMECALINVQVWGDALKHPRQRSNGNI